jgi:tetratricopeptide (TPR) repeat protein
MKIRKACTFTFLSLVVAVSALSQSQTNRSINGEVKLSNGSMAPQGLYVVLESDASGGFVTTQTDSRGKFSFNGLAPVRYRVRVRGAGYEEATEEIDLSTMPFGLLRFTLKAKAGTESSVAPITGAIAALPSDMPADAQKEYNEAFDAFQAGKFEKSIPHFKKSADKYPKYPQTFYYLGGAYASTGNFEDATKALQKSLELNDKSPETYIALGTCQFQQKQFPEAEQTLNKAVELSPGSFDAQYQLARAQLVQNKVPDSQQHLDAALKLNANSAEAHILMGNVMLKMRNPEGALKEYQEGVRLNPKGPMAEPTKAMIAKIEAALKK